MEAVHSLGQKYYNLIGSINFLRFVKNPNDTRRIFEMNVAFKKATPPATIEVFMEKLYEDSRLIEMFNQQYWPKIPSIVELETYSDGSFGKELAIFLKKWNLDTDLFPKTDLSNRSEYALSRVYQAHDAWHVITGYDPILEDELALQAFGIGQYGQPTGLLIIAGAMLNLLQTKPFSTPLIMELISEGYQRGKSAKNLLCEPLFERLKDPIEEVRRDLNIEQRNRI